MASPPGGASGSGGRKRPFISEVTGMPQKRGFRQRAHANPMNDADFGQPLAPARVDWSELYPVLAAGPGAGPGAGGYAGDGKVRFVDVGCGYGGLLIELGRCFPDTLSLGMEIRDKVSEYVRERIVSLRKLAVDDAPRGGGGGAARAPHYQNVAVVRTNTMKYLINYFEKGQLEKLFFCFADPHFKRKNHRRCARRRAPSRAGSGGRAAARGPGLLTPGIACAPLAAGASSTPRSWTSTPSCSRTAAGCTPSRT